MVNYKVNTENLSLDAYKKNAYKKISSVDTSDSGKGVCLTAWSLNWSKTLPCLCGVSACCIGQ